MNDNKSRIADFGTLKLGILAMIFFDIIKKLQIIWFYLATVIQILKNTSFHFFKQVNYRLIIIILDFILILGQTFRCKYWSFLFKNVDNI